MPRLVLLIGLPGSGKSFLAQALMNQYPGSYLVATDAIRAQLFGDEAIQGSWLQVWREVRIQFETALQDIEQGNAPFAIYDATNVVRRQRKEAIALAKAVGYTIITGVWVQTPLEVCLERNSRRDRQVPKEIIQKMARQLQDAPPALEDGLTNLILYPHSKSTGIAQQ